MKPRLYSSEGIVLGRKNFGEADRLIFIYSKRFGRISLIAKSARHPKSRKRGHIEVFNYVKFQATSGYGLDVMTEVEVSDDFSEVRKSLNKVSLAYYLCEVVVRITHEGESNEDLFDLLLSSLKKLKSTKALKKLRTDFVRDILVLLGFWSESLPLLNPDEKLEEVVERQIASVRVGKRMVQ